MRGKIEKLERVVWKTQRIDNYILELEGLFDRVSETLSEGFNVLVIDLLDGTGNPKNYKCMCIGAF